MKERFEVRLNEREASDVRAAAEQAVLPVATWMRATLLYAARKSPREV